MSQSIGTTSPKAAAGEGLFENALSASVNLSFFNAGFHAGFFSNRASLKPGARA